MGTHADRQPGGHLEVPVPVEVPMEVQSEGLPDRKTSRWGRRKPSMSVTTSLALRLGSKLVPSSRAAPQQRIGSARLESDACVPNPRDIALDTAVAVDVSPGTLDEAIAATGAIVHSSANGDSSLSADSPLRDSNGPFVNEPEPELISNVTCATDGGQRPRMWNPVQSMSRFTSWHAAGPRRAAAATSSTTLAAVDLPAAIPGIGRRPPKEDDAVAECADCDASRSPTQPGENHCGSDVGSDKPITDACVAGPPDVGGNSRQENHPVSDAIAEAPTSRESRASSGLSRGSSGSSREFSHADPSQSPVTATAVASGALDAHVNDMPQLVSRELPGGRRQTYLQWFTPH